MLTTAHEEGKDEGIKEGRQKEKEETAKRLLDEGLSIELMAKCTGLSVEEIKNI